MSGCCGLCAVLAECRVAALSDCGILQPRTISQRCRPYSRLGCAADGCPTSTSRPWQSSADMRAQRDAQHAEVRQSSAAPVDSTPRLCGADLSVQRRQLATGMDEVVAVDAIAGGDQRSGGVCRSCSTDRSSSVSTVSMPLSLHRPLPSQLGAAVLSYRVIGTCPRRGRCRTTRPAFHTTERRRRCRRRRPPCCRTHSDHSSNRRQTAGNRTVSRRQQGASSQL